MQTWPSPGNPGAPTYWPSTERVGFFDTAGVDHDQIISGTYHDGTGLGKVTFIGGHSFSTSLPYSTNAEAPYLRAFYNSLFFNGSAVAKLDLAYSPSDVPAERHRAAERQHRQHRRQRRDVVNNVSLTLAPGFTYFATTSGPAPSVVGHTLTWLGGLGDIAGGADGGDDPGRRSTPRCRARLGTKQFGTFHATYGDVFGEGFTANVCRDDHGGAVPAPIAHEDAGDAGARGYRQPGDAGRSPTATPARRAAAERGPRRTRCRPASRTSRARRRRRSGADGDSLVVAGRSCAGTSARSPPTRRPRGR